MSFSRGVSSSRPVRVRKVCIREQASLGGDTRVDRTSMMCGMKLMSVIDGSVKESTADWTCSAWLLG